MKKYLVVIGALLVLLLSACGGMAQNEPDPVTVVQDFYTAIAEKQLETAMSHVADDALFINPTGTFTGKFKSVAKGDLSWAERHISRRAGVRLVGADPAEWLEGPQVAKFLKEEVKALGNVVQISCRDTEAYEEDSVGWGLSTPILTLPNGKQIAPRWSAVFHREDGEWKLVQLHASVGVAHEELLRMEAA